MTAPKRMDDRVHFLTEQIGDGLSSKFQVGDARIGVILWTEDKADTKPITLTVDAGPFSLHQTLTPEAARLIGHALLSAAGEADTQGMQP
jgi:hypothetical protein